ncbi:unnamed protein product [Prorocentrum cordatum]|uniref:Protein kinase domain-containing protein n=1 Tax=Prorocentrum cordatum TaxID=2364126 RepID=A0ABN9Y713_9DINO|nr:unnamed protein product [Polarella glacialis]
MSAGVGSWRYMAPEVARGEQYTDRGSADSFALVMWFMSTGQAPYVEEFGVDAVDVLEDFARGSEPRPSIGRGSGVVGSSGAASTAMRRLVEDCWHVCAAARPSAHQCVLRLAEVTVLAEQRSWSRGAGIASRKSLPLASLRGKPSI